MRLVFWAFGASLSRALAEIAPIPADPPIAEDANPADDADGPADSEPTEASSAGGGNSAEESDAARRWKQLVEEAYGGPLGNDAVLAWPAKAFGSTEQKKLILPKDTKIKRHVESLESREGQQSGDPSYAKTSERPRRIRAKEFPHWLYSDLDVDSELPNLSKYAYLDDHHRELYVNELRNNIRRRKVLLDLGRGKLDKHAYYEGVDPDTPEPHPVWPGWSPLWWRFQFALLLVALLAMFLLELVCDICWLKFRGVHFSVRASTVLKMGANCRVFAKASWRSCIARCVTCIFLHLHPFHLTTNCLLIYMAVGYAYDGVIGKADEFVWIMHWNFAIFVLTGLVGSLYSLKTTLRTAGVSIGASGGCLGFGVALLALSVRAEGIPPERRVHFISVALTIAVSCIPFAKMLDSSSELDMGAHIAGAAAGLALSSGLSLCKDSHALMVWGNRASLFCLVLVALAFSHVIFEFFTSTPARVVEAFALWNGVVDKKEPLGERHSAPGRVRTELLDVTDLADLAEKPNSDEPEVVLRRFRDWMRWRRHSLGPGENYGTPHGGDVEAEAP